MPDSDLGVQVARLAADLTDLKAGLREGQQQLQSFQQFTENAAAKIRSVLEFAGIAATITAAIYQLKQFGASILEEGGKVEVLRAAADAIAGYYGMSAASLDFYTQKLKEKNITEAAALQAESGFLKAGVSVAKLPELADAAKVLGASLGMPMQEAFDRLVEGIVKGTPKELAKMSPGIREVLAGMSQETRAMLDSTLISGAEKSQILTNAVLEAAARMKGAAGELDASYYAQLNAYQAKVAAVKEGLFELLKPIGMAITKEEIKSWDDFYTAVGNSKAALKETGEVVAVYVGRLASGLRSLVSFVAAHKDLLLALLEIKGIVTVMKWTGLAAGAEAVSGILVKLGLLRVALTGPWQLLIVATLVGANEILNWTKRLATTHPEYVGGAEWVPDEDFIASGLAAGQQANQQAQDRAFIASHQGLKPGPISPFGGFNPTDAERAAMAKKTADAAAAKRLAEANAQLPGKGGGGAGAEEDLLGEHLRRLEAERHADLAAAEDRIKLSKATQDQEKALLEQQRAEGLIDGATYYQKLQDMQKAETALDLSLIEKKRQAQKDAYRDQLAVLAQQQAQEKFSPEVGDEKRGALAAKNRQEMAKLDAEAAKRTLDNQKKIAEELTKQLDLKRQYTLSTEQLDIENAQLLGQISEQEATLRKLALDWGEAKRKAIEAIGGTPQYDQYSKAQDINLAAKQGQTLYGGYSQQITQGISSLMDSLLKGGQDLQAAANNVFKGLFNEALKPGLKQLQDQLTAGFMDLFGAAGGGLASAVLGAIGLLGMLFTSSSKSSFSSAGVTSAVTAHEVTRGIIAGDTSLPIAQISTSLQDALVSTNDILLDIKDAINGRGGAGGNLTGNFSVTGLAGTLRQVIQDEMEKFFEGVAMLGPVTR